MISADAFTAYRGIDAGTAKPTARGTARRAAPPHRREGADRAVQRGGVRPPRAGGVAARSSRAGGSRSSAAGPASTSARSSRGSSSAHRATRRSGRRSGSVQERRGAPWLVRALTLLDPESGARISQRDGARAIRYLEIAFSTGRRPSDLFRERPGERWDGPVGEGRPHVAAPGPLWKNRAEVPRVHHVPAPRRGEAPPRGGCTGHGPGDGAIGYRETAELRRGTDGCRRVDGNRRPRKRAVTPSDRKPGSGPSRISFLSGPTRPTSSTRSSPRPSRSSPELFEGRFR